MSTSPDRRSSTTRLTVVDQRRLIRDGLSSLLECVPGVECVQVGVDTDEVVALIGVQPKGWSVAGYRAAVWINPTCSVDEIVAEARSALASNRIRQTSAIDRDDRCLLQAASDGASTREIAERFGVSVRTVERRKQVLFRRLGAYSQANALAVAVERGLLAG